PDLIYLPEQTFDVDEFVEDVKKVAAAKNNKVMVVISEGIKDREGKYISEYFVSLDRDSFGHALLGGTATVLAGIINDKTNIKVRPIEFSLLQRCAAHIASGTDIEEAFNAGKMAVKYAIDGHTDQMVAFIRDEKSTKYKINYELMPVDQAANTEKKIPDAWIKAGHVGLTDDFYEYALPLIQGASNSPVEDGLPRFARLKKISAKK
ncbi:MAG: 6-phosphofructokinase, partial [Bacilli bacterium]|nr:6-phosphofructokinase [Bacilli bacterium]